MKNKVRIGKDFTIRWALLTSEGEPYAINKEAAILRVYSPYGVKDAAEFNVAGNVVIWVFKGKDQKHLGDYTIELVENNGQDGMLSVDSVDAFTLVAHTNEESLNDEGAVEIQTIELTSQIALAPVTTGGGGGDSYDDTKIKQDIADLQAKDVEIGQELTELSERVGNLEEDEPIFKAIYGETKIEEIIAAYEAGKVVHCDYNSLCYELVRINNGEAFFAAALGIITYRMICSAASKWVGTTFSLEETKNKVTTLSSSSTDTQYPSAKAVYDALQNVGGEKEWKCVFDGRMEVGERIIKATTYADGTPLNAQELICQILIDEPSPNTMQGYVIINSTNNKTNTMYGALYTELSDSTKVPNLEQITMKASPVTYMVAQLNTSMIGLVAQGSNTQGRIGNQGTPQIYENIVFVQFEANVAVRGNAPHIKIYAR